MNYSRNTIKGLMMMTCGIGGSLLPSNSLQAQEAEKPNIIFIMADDHANRAISAYGGGINQTPNIDRIAREGAIFRNNFCANSICGPSRATILTGKHSHMNGVTGNACAWDGSQTLFPRIMKEEGYNTALIGKWHLNSNPGDEFDYWKILMGAGRQGFYYNPDFVTSEGNTEMMGGYSTDLITDEALKWLDQKKDDRNPFMLFVQFKAPHVPRMPEFRFMDRYVNDTIPEPETLFDDYKTRAPYAEKANMKIGKRIKTIPLLENHDPSGNIYYARMTKEQLAKWHSYKDPETRRIMEMKRQGMLVGKERKRVAYQMFIKDYLRCIDGVDENVGRLLAWLDQNKKIKENTIVVYSSDQSYFTGQHGYAEKRFMYEDGMRMPLLMRWPKVIKPGTEVDALVQNIDFAPSFLNMAGLNIPGEMQGKSFLPLVDGEKSSQWRKALYYHYYDHGKHNVPRHEGVRTDRYKLIHYYTEDVWEFYDLKQDLQEVNNLYGNAEYGKEISQMQEELFRLRKQYLVPERFFQPPYVPVGRHKH
ncbi:MAG: sulfatase [Marinifilaceae bacterium]